MINPVQHAATPEKSALQGGAVRGDGRRVRGAAACGRGGWSWYTGSSGWMYRLMLESLLGLTRTATI
jgi:cellobiose phosphorylase